MFDDEFISLSDLFVAYKKAKSDAFFESLHLDALAFSNYEKNINRNLAGLLKVLRAGSWVDDPKFNGGYLFAPKSLRRPAPWNEAGGHFSSLDPCEDWLRMSKTHQARPIAEFRLVMAASVNFQIINALWIMKVGHLYEAQLSKDLSYGNRLRRRRAGWRSASLEGEINADSLGLFNPYFTAYKDWRGKGLAAIRKAAEDGRTVFAATMDARRFYHNISPEFLLREDYLRSLGIELTKQQLLFTRQLIDSLKGWYKETPDFLIRPEGALPVGLSSSKVIANVALALMDRDMASRLKPIYYGRYVDDIFLVVEPAVELSSSRDFFAWLSSAYGRELIYDGKSNETTFCPEYLSDSSVVFAQEKQKVFCVQGAFGLDLVAQIEQQIKRRSSEYRLLPEVPETIEGMLNEALLATSDATLEADALRKADAVSIRRLGFAMLLSDVESYSRDLSPAAWKYIRCRFFELVERYVLTPQGIFDYFSYIVRVLGLAVAAGDCLIALKLVDKFKSTVDIVRSTAECDKSHLERMLQLYARNMFQVSLQSSTVVGFKFSVKFIELMKSIKRISEISTPSISVSSLKAESKKLLFTDMGRRSYKDVWVNYPARTSLKAPRAPRDLDVQRRLRLGGLRTFFRHAPIDIEKLYWPGLAFPTRPLTINEITAIAPDILRSRNLLRGAIFSLRGARTKSEDGPLIAPVSGRSNQFMFSVPSGSKPTARVAVVSYMTKLKDWKAAFEGRPNKSLERYKRFNRAINDILRSERRLDYVVFPEASVPRRWAYSSATKLSKSGISVLVGLENESQKGVYFNDAMVSLTTSWPGYKSHVVYMQPKLLPAHEEADYLQKKKRFMRKPKTSEGRLVYKHGDHFFGVLICSDFTNIDNRRALQGLVDSLFVLEWNRDVNSFSALVEAAAQDLHAYIIQSNNREYGDSRVRAPLAQSFARDIVRVKGGDDDYFVLAPVELASIRSFHAGGVISETWKPLPIGFSISQERLEQVSVLKPADQDEQASGTKRKGKRR